MRRFFTSFSNLAQVFLPLRKSMRLKGATRPIVVQLQIGKFTKLKRHSGMPDTCQSSSSSSSSAAAAAAN